MESVEAMTEAAEPRQQSVFKGVREFKEFPAGENFVDVFEDFHEVHRETFQRFGADFVAVRERFDGLRNEAESEERIFEFGHEIPPKFFGFGPVVDHDLEREAFDAFVEGVDLLGGDGDELEAELIEADRARGDFVESFKGRKRFAKAHGGAVDGEREKDALAFEGDAFEMATNRVKRAALPGGKGDGVSIERNLDFRDRGLLVSRTLHKYFIGKFAGN
jgi:hypothetical protein